MPVKHKKTDTIANWTQAQLDAQIALGNYPPGTLITDIVLPADWNDDHNVSVSVSEIAATTATITPAAIGAPSGSGTSTGTNTGDQTSVTGNAGTATALQNARLIGNVSFNGTADIVPQTIQTVDDTTDTTCFILFGNASGAQSQQLKTNSGLAYNAATNAVAATAFAGALSGNATTATTLATTRTFSITGALTATAQNFNGGANVTLTLTGTLPEANGGTGLTALGTGVATFLGTPSSANFFTAVTDEVGSGKVIAGDTWIAFTPAISGATTGGTGTYTTQLGYYTRLGNIVFYTADLVWTAHTGTGAMRVTGLPVTCINAPFAAALVTANLNSSASTYLQASVVNSTSYAEIYQTAVANGSTSGGISMKTSGSVRITGFYFV